VCHLLYCLFTVMETTDHVHPDQKREMSHLETVHLRKTANDWRQRNHKTIQISLQKLCDQQDYQEIGKREMKTQKYSGFKIVYPLCDAV
jgi:hypothetical protein